MYNSIESAPSHPRKSKVSRVVTVIVTVIVALAVVRLVFPSFSPLQTVREALLAAKQPFQSKFQSYIDSGIEQINQGKPEAAQKYFLQAIEAEPQNPEGYYRHAMVSLGLGRWDWSMAYLKKVVEIDPNHALAYFQMGAMFLQQGDKENAMVNLSKAIELKPDLFDALLARSRLYRDANKVDEEIADYKQALAHIPSSTNSGVVYLLHTNLAWAYMSKNMVLEGVRAYSAAIDTAPPAKSVTAIRNVFTGMFVQQINALDRGSEAYAEYEKLMKRMDEILGITQEPSS